jgi:hypothetical protein
MWRIPIQNSLKRGAALSPFSLNFPLGFAIRQVHENREELKFVATYWRLLCADKFIQWKQRECKKITESFKFGLEIGA